MLRCIGLRQIELRLCCFALGDLDVDDGGEAAAGQRFGGSLHHLRIGQGLPRCAHRGGGSIQHEVGVGHVEDHLLMRRREARIAGDRELFRRFNRGSAATEIEQQVVNRELRVDFPGIEGDEPLRSKIGGERSNGVLIASEHARGQRRKIRRARNADIDGGLPRLLPGNPRRGIAALGDVDHLDQRIDMAGIDVGGRRQMDCRVRRHRETFGCCSGRNGLRWRFFGLLHLPRGVGRCRGKVTCIVTGVEQRASSGQGATESTAQHGAPRRPLLPSPAVVEDQPRREYYVCHGGAGRTTSRAPIVRRLHRIDSSVPEGRPAPRLPPRRCAPTTLPDETTRQASGDARK